MRAPHRRRFVLALIFAAGCALRLYALDRQPLWLDEASSWSFAQRSFADTFYMESIHPPLDRVLLWCWVRVIPSDSEAWLRLLPALWGCLTVAAWMWLWSELETWDDTKNTSAWIAAAAVAFSPFLIAYSQELRMYALLGLWSVLGVALLLRWLRTGQRWAGVGALVVGILALYTHYFAALSWAGALVMLWGLGRGEGDVGGALPHTPAGAARPCTCAKGAAFGNRRVRAAPGPRVMALSLLAAAICFAPWVWYVVTHYQPVARSGPDALQALGYVLLLHLVGPAPIPFDTIRWEHRAAATLWQEWLIAGVLLAVTALALWDAAKWLRANRTHRWVLLAGWGAPLALGLLVMQPLSGLLRPHYMIAASPFLLGLLAAGWGAAQGWRRRVIGAGLAGLFAVGLGAYFGAPAQVCGWELRYGKERWREVAQAVREGAQPGAVVLLAPGFLSMPFGYYDRDAHPLFALDDAAPDPDAALAAALLAAREPQEVWLVISHRWHDDTYIAALQRAGWVERLAKDFREHWGIRLRVYQRKTHEAERRHR